MIQPFLKEDAFLADVRVADDLKLHVWWLGQSGFLVRWAGRFLLFDPYLSDSLTQKYAATDKPHVRMTSRVIAPDRLDFIDVVTSSHNHTDHLDAETLRPIFAVNPALRFVLPEANRELAIERLAAGEAGHPLGRGAAGNPARPERAPQTMSVRHFATDCFIGFDDGARASVAGFEFTGIAAAHNEVERDAYGRCKFLGFVVRCGPFSIYHSGDTVCYADLEDKLRALGPIDLALLPINGNRPARKVAGNLDGHEAAQLAHNVGARCVIPCHYEMFAFNTASPEEFIRECEKIGQPYRVLRAGERLSL